MESDVRERIERAIGSNQVVLFMKGNRSAPRCGFSAQVVEILDALVPDYTTVDVLEDPGIRAGIKEFSDWPTIPQLYIGKEFVGGCDIVKQMFATGQLEQSLGLEIPAPTITITEAAAAALKDAIGEGELVRIEVGRNFEHDLSVGPAGEADLRLEAGGVSLVIDRVSARRADGLKIDYVSTEQGPAFKIDNPNEPPPVKQLSPAQLKELLDGGGAHELFDVRTPAERAIAAIEGSKLLDESAMDRIAGLDKSTPLVFVCHHGTRSQQAAEHFRSQGFHDVSNVVGGIDAWSREVDSSVPTY